MSCFLKGTCCVHRNLQLLSQLYLSLVSPFSWLLPLFFLLLSLLPLPVPDISVLIVRNAKRSLALASFTSSPPLLQLLLAYHSSVLPSCDVDRGCCKCSRRVLLEDHDVAVTPTSRCTSGSHCQFCDTARCAGDSSCTRNATATVGSSRHICP